MRVSNQAETRTALQGMGVLRRFVSFLVTFGLMFALWIIFSGIFEPLFLWMGIISSAIVAALCHELIFPQPSPAYGLYIWRFLLYLPWLMCKVFQANIHLLKIVFHPRMMEMIDPHIITFQTPLRQELSLVAFANSITLTPGTITVSVNHQGRFEVHAIDRLSAQDLPGEMGDKLQRVFEETAS